jgi:hypothetical protein
VYHSPNPEAYGHFGKPVANAGDVDGDGWDDLVVGARRESPGGVANAGMVYAFSGATRDLLYGLEPPDVETYANFGRAASGAGDVNGDGYADVVAGTYRLNIGDFDVGRAYIFDGPTGTLLCTLDTPNPTYSGYFGFTAWGGEDYDGDGKSDVVVGAPGEDGQHYAGAGKAYVFSGATAQPIWQLVSPMEEVGGAFGRWVGEGADANGDGRKEVVTCAPGEDAGATDAGRAYVFGQMLLGGGISGGSLVLDWSYWPVAAEYWVYGADNEPFFNHGFAPDYLHRLVVLSPEITTWSSSSGVGDPLHNWTYSVLAVDDTEQELCRSNRIGEHDFALIIGQ